MALNGGFFPAKDISVEAVPLRGNCVGTGAGTAPTQSSNKDSQIASCARSADGQYTATFKARVFPWKTTLYPSVEVVSTGATALRANVTGVNAATGVVTFETRNAATGALAAAASTDTIYIKLDVKYSDT